MNGATFGHNNPSPAEDPFLFGPAWSPDISAARLNSAAPIIASTVMTGFVHAARNDPREVVENEADDETDRPEHAEAYAGVIAFSSRKELAAEPSGATPTPAGRVRRPGRPRPGRWVPVCQRLGHPLPGEGERLRAEPGSRSIPTAHAPIRVVPCAATDISRPAFSNRGGS